MALRMAPRPASSAAAPTQTQTNTTGPEQDSRQGAQIGVLRLRGEPRPRPGVRWADDVVDNSQMNKKKSKVCCIYHKPREVGESSSESSSSSSDSDSDSDQDNSTARMGGKGASKKGIRDRKGHECAGHDHQHDQAEDSSASDSDSSDSNGRPAPRGLRLQRQGGRSARRRSPNAYEKMKTYSTAAAASGGVTGAPLS